MTENRLVRATLRGIWLTTIMATVAVLTLVAIITVGALTGKARLTTMLTGSMAPDLPTGAMVVMTPKDTADVTVGDVIAFNPPGSTDTVIHRVIEITGYDPNPVVVTKGDINEDPDPWAPISLKDPEVWTPQASFPGIGQFFLWTQGSGFIYVTLAGATIVWLAIMWSIWKPRDEELENETDIPSTGEKGPQLGLEESGETNVKATERPQEVSQEETAADTTTPASGHQ